MSKARRTSMIAKDPMFANTIGQRVGITFNDAKVTNIAYCSG